MNETHVTIQGRLVADPELKATRAGVPFASFRIASTVRRPVPGQPGSFEDGATSFYSVTAFRALGLNVARSLHKGEPVTVHGRQRVNQWSRADGAHGTTVEIDARSVGHDLCFGTSAFAKVVRAQSDPSDRMSDPVVQATLERQAAESERPFAAAFGGRPGTGGSFGDPLTDPYVVEGFVPVEAFGPVDGRPDGPDGEAEERDGTGETGEAGEVGTGVDAAEEHAA
jgi:single-strand DNA-binding protein